MATKAIGPPAVGDPAPDFSYKSIDGELQRLSSLWTGGPALIVWLRHFG